MTTAFPLGSKMFDGIIISLPHSRPLHCNGQERDGRWGERVWVSMSVGVGVSAGLSVGESVYVYVYVHERERERERDRDRDRKKEKEKEEANKKWGAEMKNVQARGRGRLRWLMLFYAAGARRSRGSAQPRGHWSPRARSLQSCRWSISA